MSKRGLGKGLDAFFPESDQDKQHEAVVSISIKDIVPNPFQPRNVFDDAKIDELAQSIKTYGVLQPVVLRKVLSGYQLIAGERRWRAAQIAGLKAIPAVIRQYNDAEMTEIALIENVQREDLNPIEEAYAYRRLMEEFCLTQEEVARKIGKSRSWIANIVRLINLPEVIQDYVSRETLTVGQVRPLLAISEEDIQIKLADKIIEEDLSARDVEELIKNLSNGNRLQKEKKVMREHYIIEAEEKLKEVLGTKVQIKQGKTKSKIEIEYYSLEDLERILESLETKPNSRIPHSVTKQFVV